MITGVNPGRHGIFGFLANTPQERPVVAHSGLISAPTLWLYLEEQGVTSGSFHIPMTYPAASVEGFMVSGGLAAGWTRPEMREYASSEAVRRVVTDVAGSRYPLDTVVSYEKDWRSPEVVGRVQEIQRLRRRVLGALLDRFDPDFVFTVFEGPDRLQHLHYQFLVECSDWFHEPLGSQIRDLANSYFQELDRAVQDLVDWVGPDGQVVVVSDHGAGPWEKTINTNLLLAEWGWLQLPRIAAVTRKGIVAGAGQRLARRVVPRGLLQRAKARVGGRIDWANTQAFASHVAEQGIHVNRRGLLPHGTLEEREALSLIGSLVERLEALTDPDDGNPVVDRTVRREEVIWGPRAARAPDLFPLCRDQRYELSDTLAAEGPFTDHRDRPWGYHHIDGVFLAAGPNVQAGSYEPGLQIVDVLPTVFHLAGLEVPEGLDGKVVVDALAPAVRAEPKVSRSHAAVDEASPAYPFSPEEEAEIEESLRGLGYIE
jgi:predicted AlkP superfamily phosphohydrolase/phosphomutase